MNSRSISFRLVAWHAAISLLVCVGFGLYTYFGLSYFLQLAEMDTLHRRAHEVAAILEAHMGQEGGPYTIELIKTSYAPENNDRFIRIRKPDGSLLYISGRPTDRAFDPTAVPLLPARTVAEASHPITLGNLLLVQASAVVNGRQYLLDCGESKLPDAQVLRGFLVMLGIGVPVILIVVVAGGAVLVRQALKPVRRIINTSKAITSSNLGQRLPIAETADEIEYLSVVLNEMIGRLEAAFQHSQRFSADASHELRTPLTIMRVELESMSQEPVMDTATREKIASILEETERMGKMVEGLLAISRLDTGEAVVNVSRFDLSILVAATAEQITLLADEKHITVRCNAVDPVEVTGDRFRLQQVIVNLLDNAIKYSPTGGEILLNIRTTDREAVLEVIDSGPGIPPEALPHVFERFFRADSVRTHSVNGTGLGLSIVRSICLAHGGTVEAATLPVGGCRITVCLPLPPPNRPVAGRSQGI
ncbi:MAG: ATP-binding protein [Chthoniobacteraceae bacterium]